MSYEAVIGLELHIQLATNTKLFSSSSTRFGAETNTQVSIIDLGLPGVLPVLNKRALEYAVIFGLALGSKINKNAFFMRKNYFYPDSPKGYQISQLDDAIIQGGEVVLDNFNSIVRINRGQLEEDAGKSVHDFFIESTGIDLNRAGMPLIELVTEPDIRSAAEAVAFMRKIHHLVKYLGICDGNMQEGSLRCDANVSIREKGTKDFNSRVELKNINSFRFVEQAIELEIERQIEIVNAGGKVEQETRLFDALKQETRTMRSKEEANDYRYFPDPDLLPFNIDDSYLAQIHQNLPELPNERLSRYEQEYGLDYDILLFLMQDKETAEYFEKAVDHGAEAKMIANWMQNELSKNPVTAETVSFTDCPLQPQRLTVLLSRINDGTISAKMAKKLLPDLWEDTELSVDKLIDAKGLRQINDDAQIQQWIDEVLAENTTQVDAYQNGQNKMLGYLVGQVLKRSQGKANPKVVNRFITERLG